MQSLNNMIITRRTVHRWIYFIGLCLLIISIPTSRSGISISQILLGVNWLAEGQFKTKYRNIIGNKPAIAFILIFLLHIVTLLWTEDLYYAIFSDLKTKLPILTLTIIVVSSHSLNLKKTYILLFIFVATVFSVSLIGFYIYIIKDITDFRNLAPYATHLYFNMMLIISAFIMPWLARQVTKHKTIIISSYLISCWLISFIIIMRSLSGLISLAGVLIFITIWIVVNYKSVLPKVVSVTVLVLSIITTIWFLQNMYNKASYEVETNFDELELYSAIGNRYYHDTTRTVRENGHLVYIYVCDKELEEEWNKVSDIGYYGKDKLNHIIRYTLLRYMASKGFKKDKEHFKLLTEHDIKAVEEGTTNYLYKNWSGISIRLHQTFMGLKKYRETKDPNWSTLTQRIELWKASYLSFLKKPLFGWGTGDIYKAVEYGLNKNNSKLEKYTMKPHNQYLHFLLIMGSTGFVLILFLYVYTAYKTGAYKIMPFNIFMLIFAIDMFGNNPIDAQYGVAMFVIFTLLFCFIYPNAYKNNAQIG